MVENQQHIWINDDLLGRHSWIRTIKSTIPKEYLDWHTDETDRKVTVIKANGWSFQFDNQKMQQLVDKQELFIRVDQYHRLVKTDKVIGELKLKIIMI